MAFGASPSACASHSFAEFSLRKQHQRQISETMSHIGVKARFLSKLLNKEQNNLLEFLFLSRRFFPRNYHCGIYACTLCVVEQALQLTLMLLLQTKVRATSETRRES